MAEILMAPQAVSASTQASGRGNESRADEAARADTDAGTSAPFAAVLKSRSEKHPAESAKETASAAESPPAMDTATAAATVAPLVLLSMLEADRPLAANAEQAALAPAASPAGPEQVDPLAMLASVPLPTTPGTFPVGAAPTSALPSFDTSSRSAATPANPAGTVTPTPTFPMAEAPDASNNASRQHVEPAADFAVESSAAPDKLAVEAAIAATSAKAGITSTSLEPNETEFRTIIERATNNPAAIGMQAGGTSAPAAPTPGLRMESSLGQAGWRDEVGQKLTWMVSNNRQQAELVLNPPQLGRIEVTLTIEDDRASVSFATPHAAVRETLENSMARLREMLADAGVTLGQTHVGTNSGNDPNPMHPKNDRLPSTRSAGEGHAATIGLPGSESAWRSTAGRGMVDVFA